MELTALKVRQDRTGFASILERNAGRFILAGLIITTLLLVPFFLMKPDRDASFSPGGEAFDLREEIGERFAPSIHGIMFLAESHTGDMLTGAALSALYRSETRLRAADELGALSPVNLPEQSYLSKLVNPDDGHEFMGVSSLADAVQTVLETNPITSTSLDAATDEQVKLAIHQLLNDPTTSHMRNFLSRHSTAERRVIEGKAVDYWVSPAITLIVAASNDKLGGGILDVGVGGDQVVRDKEELSRNIQTILRGDQQVYSLWGVAIDANLEAEDEGETAGIFVMYTVIGAVLVVGLSLRSYWAMALTGAGLGILIIWLKGISNLMGLEGGLVIDLIVPVAMIALGVDFAVHAIRRYQEQRSIGYGPNDALRLGITGVMGALLLAMLSDAVAFLSNAVGGIEAIVHFGIAAGIAVGSAFLVLGVMAPLALMKIDQTTKTALYSNSLNSRLGLVAKSAGVALLSGAAAISSIVELGPPGINVAILAGMILAMIVVPAWYARKRNEHILETRKCEQSYQGKDVIPGGWVETSVEAIVIGIAKYRTLVLLAAISITVVATVFATRLNATLDVKDFFDNNSDFVMGLDKFDEHVGDQGGEPGVIYIQGDLTHPNTLKAIRNFIIGLQDNPTVAKRADGEPAVQPVTILTVLNHFTKNPYAKTQIKEIDGLDITDTDENGIPDSQSQIKAIFEYITKTGVPIDSESIAYTPAQVAEVLYLSDQDASQSATTLAVGIIGTREQSNVVAARSYMAKSLNTLASEPTIEKVGLTGSPFTRQAELDATTKSLQMSLPIAATGTFLLLLLTIRSVRYAVVTVIPIGLVVVWLYGLMYLFGFALNFVTATIGAVSIGVGIDYAIHMTERFREEMSVTGSSVRALRRAARGTGVALASSATSSIVGFAIMGLAPMPLFSSYGVLTALMIFLAFSASVLVLPSLLLLVTPSHPNDTRTTNSEKLNGTRTPRVIPMKAFTRLIPNSDHAYD